jgi:hypothetical protein
MSDLSRRAFLGVSLIAAETLRQSGAAIAAPQCVTGSYPSFLPNRLSVDCASRLNFRLFRQNTDYLGLTGIVSMTSVRGRLGSYSAGNLFLFPWLKAKGRALGQGKVWPAAVPISATQYLQASPVPVETLPIDEYFCRIALRAPWPMFIGFALDVPFGKDDAQLGWFSNVDKLADGAGVGIDWTSQNLNRSWFGGSNWIPNTTTCNGKAWRALIVDGLNQVSARVC